MPSLLQLTSLSRRSTGTMKIATWNVNSVRARLERLLAWLQKAQPDIVCLQELKTRDDAFPYDEIQEAGYHADVFGQKTFNGVGILSRIEPQNVHCGHGRRHRRPAGPVPGGPGRRNPRHQRVHSQRPGRRLGALCLQARTGCGGCGPFWKDTSRPRRLWSFAATSTWRRDELDVADPAAWEESVLYHPTSRAALEELDRWGLVDVHRQQHPEGRLYSWWDYRMLAFPKNDGLRLDYIFATAPLAAYCTSAEIDRQERKGAKPSDHAPVIAEFDGGCP